MPRRSPLWPLLTAWLLSTPAFAQTGIAFGGPADNAFAAALWQELVDAKLAGPGGFQSRPYNGQHPHGAVLQLFDLQLTVAGETNRLVLSRNYGGPGVSVQAVANDPVQYLNSVTVMFKRPGYDPQNQDWFWAKYLPDGSLDKNPKGVLLAGRVDKNNTLGGCIACHRVAGGDMLFGQSATLGRPVAQ